MHYNESLVRDLSLYPVKNPWFYTSFSVAHGVVVHVRQALHVHRKKVECYGVTRLYFWVSAHFFVSLV